MLCWLWPNSGHVTDTGECEGQRGCQAPEVRKRKHPSSLEITQAHCVHAVGTETHTGFLPATTSYPNPNLNHNRPTKELIQQECFSLNQSFRNIKASYVWNFLSRKHVLPKSTIGHFPSWRSQSLWYKTTSFLKNWHLLLSIHTQLTHIFRTFTPKPCYSPSSTHIPELLTSNFLLKKEIFEKDF